jgi:hypothetical protein
MRATFVAASLVAHFGVVGLAFLVFDPASSQVPPRSATLQESGLLSVELGAERERAQVERTEVRSLEQDVRAEAPQATDLRTTSSGVRKPQTNKPLGPLAPPAKAARNDSSRASAEPVVREAFKANSVEATTSDWLSIDQQLPEAGPPQNQAPVLPKRDELVERLLAKEREKQRAQQRQELERANAYKPSGGTPSRQPTVAHEGDGATHEQADAWTELTRWLPRAASGDPTWEQLPVNTRIDVRVRFRTIANQSPEVTAVGSAPEVVVRLLNRTAHLIRRGHFDGTSATERRFSLRIRLSQGAERELWIAHTTPDPPKPGVGSFVSPTGRRFDVWVAAEP